MPSEGPANDNSAGVYLVHGSICDVPRGPLAISLSPEKRPVRAVVNAFRIRSLTLEPHSGAWRVPDLLQMRKRLPNFSNRWRVAREQ